MPSAPTLPLNMRCTVLLNTRSPGIGNGLTYETKDLTVKPGALVRVPLRKKSVEGIVLSLDSDPQSDQYETKEVEQVLGTDPLLSPSHIQLLRWIAGTYYCSLRSALTPFLPQSPWRNASAKDEIFYTVGKPMEKGGKKQMMVMEYMNGKDTVPREQLRRDTAVSSATITSLIEKGYIKEDRRPPEAAAPSKYLIRENALPALTPIQQKACDEIRASEKPSLLFGITGSGKTEVYAHLIADAARQGKQSIVLVPEILLTEHTIHRFEQLFDRSRIAIIHSRLTPSARRLEWMRIHSGEAALVVGSRSALFAPCRNLGIVIIDEEHEWTYKNEQTPRYHARETAQALCNISNAKLVLGSATPSLESWSRGKSGEYTLVRLPERYMNRALPTVKIVDLAAVKFGSLYPFSPPLLQAIEQRLEKGEQTVLFLNRRGVASAVMCLECRRRLTSPASQLPFTMHKSSDGRPYLLDHIAGISAEVPSKCPHCGSARLLPVGAGTQRLEDVIASVFPKARVLRADSDSLQYPEQMRQLLSDMRERRADILLGTQSVVKGLDLPGVTLAAVLIADIGMSLPHFRAGERVFQLLTQLTGRSGRSVPGDVIIQTFRPESVEVVASSQHRTEDYLEAELKLRETLKYPPSTKMIRFLINGPKAEARAKAFHQTVLQTIAREKTDATAMVAPTLFGLGQEWHILLKGHYIRLLLPKLNLVDITVDVDPVDVV
jgi:primosomal protein N' (replication factor Y) (superfamily II helicase)